MTEFLLLTNLLTNTENIVKETIDFKKDTLSLFKYLKTQPLVDFDNNLFKIDIQENNAIVFSTKEHIQKGYIWNKKTLRQTNLFKISKISKLEVSCLNARKELDICTKQDLFFKEPVFPTSPHISPDNSYIQYGMGYANNIVEKQSFSPRQELSSVFKVELLDRIKLLRRKYVVESSESEWSSDEEVI